MQSLSSRIRSRLAPEHLNPSDLVQSARDAYAARGFSELGGPYFSDLSRRAIDAMDAIYEAAFAALQEHCAFSGKPSAEFTPEFLALLRERLDAISRSIVPEVGGSSTASGHRIEVKALSLISMARDHAGTF